MNGNRTQQATAVLICRLFMDKDFENFVQRTR